ncbi:MAG: hypothetical protein B0D86_00690, partial [Candidatus Sedimenticola endophacoides]
MSFTRYDIYFSGQLLPERDPDQVRQDLARLFKMDLRKVARVSLPRERFWDIPVPKIDSPTRQPLLPRPSCAHHDSVPHIAAKLLVRN